MEFLYKLKSMASRPVLVQLGSRASKDLIMESLYKLKSMQAKIRNVVVADGMTKLEPEEYKAFVNEAKLKTENNSWNRVYWVRGPPRQTRIVMMSRN